MSSRRGASNLLFLLALLAFPPWAAALSVAVPAPDKPAASTEPADGTTEQSEDEELPAKDPWIDRAHDGVFRAVWRSAMRMDQWFGSEASEAAYLQTSGSLAPALLWDEFNGFKPRLRFQVDVPLPQLNERFHAFIGRVNREEYVTERSPGSGAFARQYGPLEDDETLFGIRYRDPEDGGHWDADAGLRVRSPLDPYVKGSFRFMKGSSDTTLFSFRETLFWQNSEKFGFTSRVDIEKILRDVWLFRWTGSGTISERSEGVRGYTSLTVLRGLPNRRAFAAELFTKGELDADVPLGDYGLKLAYRRSIARDWLIMESRVSLTFPREELFQVREATLGVGIGFEMFFGTDAFLARPVTF
jgi:hypothetical protein